MKSKTTSKTIQTFETAESQILANFSCCKKKKKKCCQKYLRKSKHCGSCPKK